MITALSLYADRSAEGAVMGDASTEAEAAFYNTMTLRLMY